MKVNAPKGCAPQGSTLARRWKAGYERLACATFKGGVWHIQNVRSSLYPVGIPPDEAEEQARPRWGERVIHERDVVAAYFLHSRFSRAFAHDFLTFDIRGSRPLAVSKEMRYTPHYEWSAWNLLRNTLQATQSMCVIVGEEFDVMFVRTNVRKDEKLFAYPLALSQEQVRLLFRSVMRSLARENDPAHPVIPRNPLRESCAGFVLGHLTRVPGVPPLDTWHHGRWMTAHSDRLLARAGLLRGIRKPDRATQQRFFVNDAVRHCGQDEGYSLAWRRAIGVRK